MGDSSWVHPGSRSSFTREAFRVLADQGRFPGSRFIASLPAFPGLPRVAAPYERLKEWLAGYSGGTAQDFDLLPFCPSEPEGTLTMDRV
jgi:hypothetical protein